MIDSYTISNDIIDGTSEAQNGFIKINITAKTKNDCLQEQENTLKMIANAIDITNKHRNVETAVQVLHLDDCPPRNLGKFYFRVSDFYPIDKFINFLLRTIVELAMRVPKEDILSSISFIWVKETI